MPKISFYPFSEKTEKFAPPPFPASKAVPDWYKAQPGTINEAEAIKVGTSTGTIKRCMPIFDVMTAGYIIPFPCDIYIDATNPDKIEFSIPMALKGFSADLTATHAPEQYSHYPIDKDIYHKDVFRIMPFWAVKTDPGYSTLFLNPFHKDKLPFRAFEGMIDTDKFITDGHISMLVEKNFKGVIKQGTPFVQVIPIRREDWQMELIESSQATKDFMRQRIDLRSTFVNGYKNKFRSKKEYN
jgi:hypothetical protein